MGTVTHCCGIWKRLWDLQPWRFSRPRRAKQTGLKSVFTLPAARSRAGDLPESPLAWMAVGMHHHQEKLNIKNSPMNFGSVTARLHAPFKHMLLSNNPVRLVCINPTGSLNPNLDGDHSAAPWQSTALTPQGRPSSPPPNLLLWGKALLTPVSD